MMTIEIFDKKLKKVLNPDAQLSCVASGYLFTEGPLWDPFNRRLLFSDIPSNTIFQYQLGLEPSVYCMPSNFANGLAFDLTGALIVCEHQTRRVTRYENDQYTILAEMHNGRRLNSPNDLIVTGDGSILFTDPRYGLREGLGGPAEPELDFQGVYRILPAEGGLQLLVDDFDAPNGLAITADQQTLFINDTVNQHIRRFKIRNDWTLAGGEILLELVGPDEGKPDGMIVDGYGHIFCTGPGGIWIINFDGDLIGRIITPERSSNLTWGEVDNRSLFITAGKSLYMVRDLIR